MSAPLPLYTLFFYTYDWQIIFCLHLKVWKNFWHQNSCFIPQINIYMVSRLLEYFNRYFWTQRLPNATRYCASSVSWFVLLQEMNIIKPFVSLLMLAAISFAQASQACQSNRWVTYGNIVEKHIEKARGVYDYCRVSWSQGRQLKKQNRKKQISSKRLINRL